MGAVALETVAIRLTLDEINQLDQMAERLDRVADLNLLRQIKAQICRSQNVHRCYGVVWRCEGCGHAYCCVEGDTLNPLCDTCWKEQAYDEP